MLRQSGTFWSVVRLASFLAAMLSSLSSSADPEFVPQVWINPGIYSRHFDRKTQFREDNIGLGAEVLLAPDHAHGDPRRHPPGVLVALRPRPRTA